MQQLQALARHKVTLLAAIMVVVGGLIIGSQWLGTTTPASDPTPFQADTIEPDSAESDASAPAAPTADAAPDEQVIVYVSGAVHSPDVYQLPKAARIKDLVVAAGGFTDEAAAERINLAERMADGQHIHVPRQDEESPAENSPNAGPASANASIDINAASAAELDGLPGIGQALAARIVEYRTSNGAFNAIEDLRNVRGIGPALFEKIAPLITVGS